MSDLGSIILVGAHHEDRSGRWALLADAGYAVCETASLDQVFVGDLAANPNLIILDRSSVGPAEHTFKAEHPEVFVLQICAGGKSHALEQGVASCVDAFLLEPVDPRELLTLVRSMLRFQRIGIRLRDSERRLELAQDAAEFAILDWNIVTGSVIHSARFAALFDLPGCEDGGPLSSADVVGRIHPEDRAVLLADFSDGGEVVRSFDKEFRVVRGDGAIRWVSSRGRFLPGPSGRVERMISLSFDITARKEAERTNAQLASIVASSIDAIVSVDPGDLVTTWNAGAERLFGFTQAEAVGQALDRVLVADGEGEDANHLCRVASSQARVFETRQKTKGGEAVDISVNSAPMRGVDGNVIGASLIMRDIASHRRREDHVRFLMRELTHRSKNLLAVIQAMARQSLSKEIAPAEFVKRFSDRLSGLAGSHDLLSAVEWRGASLVELIRSQLRHYEDLFDTRIILDGTDITIRPEAAQNIGIALHELSTNAAKYGALSNDGGTVTIAWHVDASAVPRLRMSWREADGPPVSAPTRRGFGHTVMNRVAGQALAGKSVVDFAPSGVVWTLDVPASSVLPA